MPLSPRERLRNLIRDLAAATAALRGASPPPYRSCDGSGWPPPLAGGGALAREAPAAGPQAADTPTPVTLLVDGGHHLIRVQPGQHILEAARLAGHDLPSSCTVGGCGACRQRLRSGRVDLPPRTCLTQAERDQGYVLLCVGRPVGPVILEIT